MEGMLAGLRTRLRRALQRVEEQHRQIREIGELLDRAFADGTAEQVDKGIERLRDALRAHFELEEEVVFPALHGLVPSTQRELTQLERDHGAFLELLHQLLPQEGGTSPETLDLADLRARLDAHEQREERLMGRALSSSED